MSTTSRSRAHEWPICRGTRDERRLMRRALTLASRGEGMTAPNPPVGAVIARDGLVLGEGWHHGAGKPHAEVEAVRSASQALQGATMYVTLEPCSTHGRTPPCTELIKRSGISRVVISTDDPNPAHAGLGMHLLREAGIDVCFGVLQERGLELIEGFRSLMLLGRPYITLKLGVTVDGRIADKQRHSQWITGPAARREVQRMRRASDAVMVGIGTALADNPSLLCRLRGAPVGRRAVVDGRGDLPTTAKVLSDGFADRTVVVTSELCPRDVIDGWESTGADCWVMPVDKCGHILMSAMLQRMGEEGWLRVLCEGGAGLAGALIDSELADELVCFVAPLLLGGDALPAVGGAGHLLRGAKRGAFTKIKRVGGDVMLSLKWPMPTGDGSAADKKPQGE